MNTLPVLAGHTGNGFVSETTFATERDILYKVIFDMKKDLHELKRMFVEMVQNPSGTGVGFAINENFLEEPVRHDHQPTQGTAGYSQPAAGGAQPYYLQHGHHQPAQPQQNDFDQHEEVEESLNIMDMEKDLIIKALKKHRSKRKDAALDLGISERTLYRKLKEYDIENL